MRAKTQRRFPFSAFQGRVGRIVAAFLLADLGLPEGWMAVFDDDAAKSWDEKIFRRDETCNGKTIHIVGL